MLANLNDVLLPARQGKYAVGLFNALNLEMARGVIGAAEALHAPVIVGTAEVLLPYAPLENVADLLLPMAKRASVPVVLHYDHGLTFKRCMQALQLGFTSIMYDCSTVDYDENIRRVAEMVRIAHAFGATVEAELGHVVDNEGADAHDPSLYYTDVSQARDFVERTHCDALAIAVGTAHGAYKLPPKLDFQRITDIAAAIPTPLVLHGGSGLTDEDFRRAIACGISKVNIFTDVNVAFADGARAALAQGKSSMTELADSMIDSVRNATQKKLELFNSRAFRSPC